MLLADKNTFVTAVANNLHAAGIKAMRVLVGGNEALRVKGQPVERLLINGESNDES